jgi:uncharacterized glyoxalase superfamily protein PhnB
LHTTEPNCRPALAAQHTKPAKPATGSCVAKGVEFIREPKTESYGTVAVFQDLYGNQWDLVQTNPLSAVG